MSETELQERKALADEALRLRTELGLTQSAIAEKVGIGQPEVSQIERASRGLDTIRAYVDLLRTTPKSELLKSVSSDKEKEEKKIEAVKARVEEYPLADAAISRELRTFLRKHYMTYKSFAEFSGVSDNAIRLAAKGISMPRLDTVQKLRDAMRKYVGENTPKSDQFKPKASPVKESPVEKLIAPTLPKTVPPPAPKSSIKLVVEEGKRINNGENIAPLLKLDGKTMHVFTLVPGGVFVSYVTADME